MKRISRAIVVVAMSAAAPAHAVTTLTLTFSGQISSQYDYVSGSYENITVPSNVIVKTIIPISSFSITDYGSTTLVQYGFGDTIISDPLLNYIGSDPVGNGLDDFGENAYSFSYTSDYNTDFIKSFGAQDNIYHPSAGAIWTYHTEIRMSTWEAPLNGDGSSDYPFTPDLLIPFLNANIGKPIASYNTSWGEYAFDSNGSPVYSAGKSWSSYSMALASLEVNSAVPEPATWLTMILGFGAIGLGMRRKQCQTVRYSFA